MRPLAALALAAAVAAASAAWLLAREPGVVLGAASPAPGGDGTSVTLPIIGSPAFDEAGGIVLRDAALRRTPEAWRLDARAEIALPRAIRAGLDSGVPLEFVLEVELAESRRFLPDAGLLDVERRYGLVYYELTRHYRVRSLDDGTARNYRSLGTALAGLGAFTDVALVGPDGTVPAGPLGRDAPLVARLTLRLDGRALPLPLQSPFGSAWRLASASHVWTLGTSS